MNCEICHKGPPCGPSIYRVNEKGVKGIFRCAEHLTDEQKKAIGYPENFEIVKILEQRSEPLK